MVALNNQVGVTMSDARGISADGSVVVGGSGGQAFRWTREEGIVGLGSLQSLYGSVATPVSTDGSLVVGGSISNSGFEAFRWTQEDGMAGLGYWTFLNIDPNYSTTGLPQQELGIGKANF